jgi:hypothetical protein
VQRARVLCSELAKLEILKDTFRQNSYSDHQIHRALNPSARIAPPKEKPESVAFLPW